MDILKVKEWKERQTKGYFKILVEYHNRIEAVMRYADCACFSLGYLTTIGKFEYHIAAFYDDLTHVSLQYRGKDGNAIYMPNFHINNLPFQQKN